MTDKGEMLDKKEKETMDEMQTADELLSEGTSSCRLPYLQVPRLIHKVQKLHV